MLARVVWLWLCVCMHVCVCVYVCMCVWFCAYKYRCLCMMFVYVYVCVLIGELACEILYLYSHVCLHGSANSCVLSISACALARACELICILTVRWPTVFSCCKPITSKQQWYRLTTTCDVPDLPVLIVNKFTSGKTLIHILIMVILFYHDLLTKLLYYDQIINCFKLIEMKCLESLTFMKL